MHQILLITALLTFFTATATSACSILFFRDAATGKVYIANNEDYWYDVKAYLKIIPKSKESYARLWYGWDNFAQGGVNEHLSNITADHLMVTNFFLADPAKGSYPCPRYQAMENDLAKMSSNHETTDLKRIGQVVAKAVQVPRQDKDGRTFGTLYSTFINLTDMDFKLIYKLDNTKLTQMNLNEEFKTQKPVKIAFK